MNDQLRDKQGWFKNLPLQQHHIFTGPTSHLTEGICILLQESRVVRHTPMHSHWVDI